ncbi:MAG: DegT/DnrJ/EryC1/StrS family aminotransferase [Polyangiales bacterium]
MIPLADLAREHARYQTEIEGAALRVLRSGHYILGPEVDAFERAFATYCGAKHCVGVSNGSDAIVVALQALGVGPGDEVVTTAFSYFATASTIVRAGATPVFADIDPATFNLDPAEVERRITPRTKAILAVHLFGRVADTDALADLARRRNLTLVEDIAQAAGAERRGRRAGTLGAVGCFSFFPAKPLGCDGDGGACTTDDDDLARRMRQVRVTGATSKNVHDLPGGNYRLDPLQAAILGAKLPHYEGRLARRRANAESLRQGLHGVSERLVLPTDDPAGRHVYAQFTVRHPRRDALKAALEARGVGAEVYYPVAMPLQKVLAAIGHRPGDFPHAERAAAEVLSIPAHSELDDHEVVRVVEAMRAALAEVGA